METASYLYVQIMYNIVYDTLKSPSSEGEGRRSRLKIGLSKWGKGLGIEQFLLKTRMINSKLKYLILDMCPFYWTSWNQVTGQKNFQLNINSPFLKNWFWLPWMKLAYLVKQTRPNFFKVWNELCFYLFKSLW